MRFAYKKKMFVLRGGLSKVLNQTVSLGCVVVRCWSVMGVVPCKDIDIPLKWSIPAF